MSDASGVRTWVGDDGVDRIFDAVCDTAAEIRTALVDRRETLDRENPSGDAVKAADVYADERLESALFETGAVAAYASEERDAVVDGDGTYHVAADPLDGSSNLRPNNAMGTIVGVYDAPLPASGRDLVAAAFVLYGPNTTMVVADGETASEYLLRDGDRRLLTEGLALPEEPTVYGFGGRRPDWTAGVREFVADVEQRRLKLRYGGAMIADVRQVLTHGGIFAYPELADRPEGKLRYCFECAPLALVVESAGGRASDGAGDLLDADPPSLHARTPVYLGNADLIDDLEASLD